jgi:Fe2+ or Zn2+ uptake regulation protein
MGGLSKNQKKIMELLQIKPDMTTKEIAELTLGRIVSYKTKEFASVHRSLLSLERQGCIQRVHVQLRWRLSTEKKSEETQLRE